MIIIGFHFLPFVDLIGMVWLYCVPGPGREREETNNHTEPIKPTQLWGKPTPSVLHTREQGAHTPVSLIREGKNNIPDPGRNKRTYARGLAAEPQPLIPQKTLPGPEMSAWPYPSLSRNVPWNMLPTGYSG